jgi:hypothetical protein
MQYRFYLLDAAGHIGAAEHFHASSDTEAHAIAIELWQACSDVYPDYEVWQGTRQVADRPHEKACGKLAEIVSIRQKNILDLEERLHDSFATLQSSAKLLKRRGELRKQHPKPSPAEDAPRDMEA